jgi:hypothetical protein
MLFRAYPKILRLGKEETDGILDGPVTVQEKVDGANVSIWLGDDGIVKCGSRTRELGDDEFNGFTKYVKDNPKFKEWLEANPNERLYGEWLVKHTITYPDDAYKKMYLYDIYIEDEEAYYPQPEVEEIAKELGIEYPKRFVTNAMINEEALKDFVGQTLIEGAANGEGVVIKRLDYINKYGNLVYAKQVHEKFKESNAIVFGGNNKHSDTYWEMYVVNKYCTLGRLTKIMQKYQPEINERLDLQHIPEIVGRAYHDLITEEAWEIANKVVSLDFKKLKNLCSKKFVQIYKDVLNNSLSIADKDK